MTLILPVPSASERHAALVLRRTRDAAGTSSRVRVVGTMGPGHWMVVFSGAAMAAMVTGMVVALGEILPREAILAALVLFGLPAVVIPGMLRGLECRLPWSSSHVIATDVLALRILGLCVVGSALFGLVLTTQGWDATMVAWADRWLPAWITTPGEV